MIANNMRAALITFASVLLTSAVIGNAYYQKKQFYPSVVYITKSNPSMAIIYVQAFVIVLLMGKLMRKIFFGQLRTAEMEHLIERSWYAVTETCLAFTVFRDDLSPKFVALFTLLLFLKCFHWLAEDRVDYMERSPNISLLFHIRVISLLALLGTMDFLFVHMAYHSTLTKGASVQLVFGFEYAILFAVVLNILMKYALHFVDLQNENPWEDKAVYLLYTELLMGFLKVILYLTFITIMMKIHTFPLFAIRPMYLSMRAFKKALNDVIMSRRAIRNMNTLYPDATPEELESVDNVCIICREEMTGNGSAKKLPCNHIFHVSCLRSWFQRQQTCPTCRMDVLRVTPANSDNARVQQPPLNPAAAGIPRAGIQAHILFPQNWQQFIAMQQQQQQQQQRQQQQPRNQQQTPAPNQQQNAANNNNIYNVPNNNVNNQMGTHANASVPPMMGIPPFMPFFAPPPPMPIPPQNLSEISIEQLRLMDGNDRQNIEARIRCLRNVQTLVDAAVLQLQQYSSIVSRLPSPQTDASSQAAPQTQSQQTASNSADSVPSTSSQSPTRSDNFGDNISNDSASAQEVIRLRRLQRFSQTQPPVIDNNTGSVVTDQLNQPSTSTSSSSLSSGNKSNESNKSKQT